VKVQCKIQIYHENIPILLVSYHLFGDIFPTIRDSI
jgi:hypothetical protein